MNIRYAAMATLTVLLAIAPDARAQAAKSEPKKASADEAAVIAQEKSILDALTKNDIAAFNNGLGSDFIYVDATGATRWERTKSAEMLKGCTSGKFTVEDAKTTPVGNDLIVITYKVSGEQTCNSKKSPSPVYGMSVWRKQGGRWVAVAHSETPAR